MNTVRSVELGFPTVLRCWNVSCRMAPHIYRRTANSRDDLALHLARAFVGKLGECGFGEILRVNRVDVDAYMDQMFAIFPGVTHADEQDFTLGKRRYRIDVKTVFAPNHRNILVPLDQWKNQPKDAYVCVRLEFNATANIVDRLRKELHVRSRTIALIRDVVHYS